MGAIKDISSNTSKGQREEKVRQQLRERWEKNKPQKDHVEDACFLTGLHTDGRLDSTKNPELMSITIEYLESVEEAE
jgi:hypothetical protein